MLGSYFIDIPEDYVCPITQEMMKNPVVAANGHSYEYSAIHEYLKRGNKKSPLTREILKNDVLIKNHRLRIIIQGFRDKLP